MNLGEPVRWFPAGPGAALFAFACRTPRTAWALHNMAAPALPWQPAWKVASAVGSLGCQNKRPFSSLGRRGLSRRPQVVEGGPGGSRGAFQAVLFPSWSCVSFAHSGRQLRTRLQSGGASLGERPHSPLTLTFGPLSKAKQASTCLGLYLIGQALCL